MQQVGAFDAKTHFSQLLQQVEHGQAVVITRHSRKIAILMPIEKSGGIENKSAKAIEKIRQLRRGVRLGDNLNIKDMINEGRA